MADDDNPLWSGLVPNLLTAWNAPNVRPQGNPLASAVMTNPVGTQYAGPSMGMPQGPFDPIVGMGPNGVPITATQADAMRARTQVGADVATTAVLGMTGDAPGKAPGFTAYHGSPHSFDAFDSSKIGTGEGAQAYGHGMYVAGSEDVARTYRDQLGRTKGPLAGDLKAAYDDFQGNLQELWALKQKGALVPQELADRIEASQMKYSDLHANAGHMYEVQVNADPAHFLDWDKPLSEQTPHVQEALAKVPWAEPYLQSGKFTGGQIVPTTHEGAQQLQAAGIPGIRYLDGGSRASGEGTHNHVIFDANTIEILRKYGIAGLMAGGGAAAATQTPQQ